MANLFKDSFDHYQTAELTQKWTSLAFFPTIVAGQGRCGTQALQVGTSSALTVGINVTGTPNVGFMGFAINPTIAGDSTFAAINTLAANGGGPQFTVRFTNSGAIRIVNGDGTQVAISASGVLQTGVYSFVEFGWTIHPSAGAIQVFVNGVSVINASGINLHSNVFWPGDNTWHNVTLFVNGAGSAGYYDDLYVNDDFDDGKTPKTNTFLGDVHCEYKRPAADGTYTEWTVVGGGTQHVAVDKNADPSPATPYIASSTLNQRATDTYNPLVVLTGTIFSVSVNIYCDKSDSNVRTIASMVRQGGADAVGVNQAPSQSARTYKIQSLDRDPTTGNGWTVGTVNSAEYGVKVTT